MILAKGDLVKVNSDGSLDTQFGVNGVATSSAATANETPISMLVESDDSILVLAYGSDETLALIHYTASGALDVGFGTGGVLTLSSLGVTGVLINGSGQASMIQQPDGKLLICGAGSEFITTIYPAEMVRLNTDFTVDTTFGTNGVATIPWGEFQTCLALQPDGKILIGGGEGAVGGSEATLGRLNADGSVDTSFGQDGSVSAAFANGASYFNSLIVQPDGKIFAIGNADVARYLPDGYLDPYFADDAGQSPLTFLAGTAGLLPDGDVAVVDHDDETGIDGLSAILTNAPDPSASAGTLDVAASTASVTAGDPLSIAVNRAGGSAGTITVAYTTLDGTATARADYTSTSGTLTFAPGVTTSGFWVKTVVDPAATQNLTFAVQLSDPAGGAKLNVASSTAVLTIVPAKPPLVTVTRARIVTVRLGKKSATAIVVSFSGPVNAADAENRRNYQLDAPAGKGKKAHLYTKPVSLGSAVYSPSTYSVTLTPTGRKLSPSAALRLVILGTGIHDTTGRLIDAGHEGVPGDNAVIYLN